MNMPYMINCLVSNEIAATGKQLAFALWSRRKVNSVCYLARGNGATPPFDLLPYGVMIDNQAVV